MKGRRNKFGTYSTEKSKTQLAKSQFNHAMQEKLSIIDIAFWMAYETNHNRRFS